MMKRYGILLLGLLCCSASAEGLYVTPFGGYSFGGQGVDVNSTDYYNRGKAEDSAHYGVIVGLTVSPLANSYVLYSHQQTDLIQQVNSVDQRLDEFSVDYWHTGGTLYFSRSDFRPYMTGSFGLTRLKPAQSLDASNYFSMSFGVGAQLLLTDNLALMTEIRGFATFVGNNNGYDCEQSQQCAWYYSGDAVWQGQANIGLTLQF
ncbi:outer membrane beta-barrel protein [Shewanella yunxiaonensis]|uniref:Outer membrane beta-barrel protein n=1 Tax=Shewanella yunxiaonensis TaxID=2829809 RepID=A0ABX7YVS4_9GAMM|nr:outer membrane beta-barrel protein [Shewanella yunxiaonensis]QUN06593.1 outer membrane beta-barrel protein [Shewanella yunxiaonensis]